jgi:uncharacterized protein (DUF1330 family)
LCALPSAPLDTRSARQFFNSPEYQEARKYRLGAADFNAVIVEGAG